MCIFVSSCIVVDITNLHVEKARLRCGSQRRFRGQDAMNRSAPPLTGFERPIRGASTLRQRHLCEGPPVRSSPKAAIIAPEEEGAVPDGGGGDDCGRRSAGGERRDLPAHGRGTSAALGAGTGAGTCCQ